MLQALGTQSVAPTAHGYFYDRLNSSLLFIRQGQLYCHDLINSKTSSILLANSALPAPTPSPHSLLTLSGSVVSGVERNILTTSSEQAILRGVREVVEGSHWEWYAPISLQKIQLGVCKIQENQAITYELFQFNSSTPRTVSFYASANQLKVWVNGNHPNKQHSKNIDFTAKEKWYPCVKIAEKGNTIVFLPFSTLPSLEYSSYNPFGKVDIAQPNLSNSSKPPREIAKISKLIQLDCDRFLVHWQGNSARLFQRNKQTGKFEFSSFSVSQDIAYDLFSHAELQLIQSWRGQAQIFSQNLPISEALSLIRYLISLLDSQKSERIDLYSLLLCKLALIRPYLSHLGLRIPNSLSALEVDRENLHNILKYFKLTTKPISSSSLSHSNTQFKLQGQIVQITQHYLASQSEGSIIVYTTKGCIKQLFREEVDGKLIFSKRAVTENYDEGDIRNLKTEGSFIYKILTTCLQKEKKPEELHAVSEGDVKELVRDYGIDDKSARQALQHTGNVEEALVWIFTDRKEGTNKKGEQSGSIENQKQLSVNLVEIHNIFAKLILQVGNRIFLIGVLPSELKNWVQKGEKEYVDLFSLKHEDEVEQLNWEQWFNGAKHPKLHILDQMQLQDAPHIVYSEGESVYFISFKDGACFRSKLSFNFDFVYEPQPSLKVESVEQYDLKFGKEAIFKTVKGQLITPLSYNQKIYKEGTVSLVKSEIYHNIVEKRTKINKLLITIQNGLIPTIEESSQVCLPFLVQSCAPGCNNNYSATALLNPKASFLANYSQQIVLRHLHNKIWKPTTLTLQRSSARKNINYILEGDVYLSDGHNNKSKAIHFIFSETENEKEITFEGISGYWKYIHISPIYPAIKKLPYEVGFIKIKGFDASPESYYYAESVLLEKKVGELIGHHIQILSYQNVNNSYDIKALLPELAAEEQTALASKFSLTTCISDQSSLREHESVSQLKPSEIIKQLTPPSANIQSILRSISRSSFTFSSFSKIQVFKFIDLALFYTGRLLQFQTYFSKMFKKLWENPFGKEYLLQLSQHLDSIPILPLPFMKLLISHLQSEQLQSAVKVLLAAITKTRSAKYEGPAEKNYPNLLYETQFYSDYYLNSIEGEKKNEHLFSQPQIQAELLSIKEETSRRIIVKLEGEHLISNLTLKIQRSELASKANYSVYAISPQGKELIGSGRIQEHQWGQLSKEIYKREIEEVYQNCNQLNSFGLQIPPIRAQYLQIELSFTELGNFGHPSEISKIPQGDIIPQLYGYATGSTIRSQAVEDIFVFNPQEMFFLAASAVSTVPLLKYSVSKGKQTECLYYKVQQEDASAIRTKISEKIQKRQFQSVISLQHKLIRNCKAFSSKICLDYLYTAITLTLQALHERNVKADQSICKNLYELLVRISHGPIKLTAFKALSNNIPYLVKSLQFVEEQLTSLGKLAFSYEDLLGVLDYSNSQLCQSLTRLILRVVDCEPRWTQLLIKMSSKTQAHQQIARFLATDDLWLSNKVVLEYVADLSDHFFENVFLDVINYSQLCKLVTKEEVKDRRQLMLEVIVERASEENQVGLDVVSLVFQQLPVRWDHLQKIATCCAEAVDTVVHQYLQSEDAAMHARQHQTLLELALQPKYSEEFAVFLGKVYNQDYNTFKELVLRTNGKITTLHYDCLEFLNDFICKRCNFGGIQGAKLLTEQQLSSISVAVEALKVLEKAPETAQLANQSELIEWYLLNNEYQEQNSSPANKSQGYYLMRQLIELVRSLLQNCQQLTFKVLEKYTSQVQRLRGSRRVSLAQKHKLFHRLHHGATQLSLASLPAGELAQVLVGSNSPVLATVLDELKKSTLAGEGRRGKTFIAKQIDITERFKATNCQSKDLQGGKAGVKSPSIRIPITQKQILLDSDELQWPSKVAVGFVLNDHLDNKNSILPTSLQLFGGNGKALFKIAELKHVEDLFYLSFGVKIFVADLNAFNSSGLISGGVKKLQLRLHEPVLSSTSDVLENSQRSKKGATYNVSFLHIGGYDSLPAYEPDYSQLYVTLLGFLGQPKYLPDLRTLLASDLFDQKLELIIQVLNDLLPNQSIQQLLLSLNKEGENILEHVLRSPSANPQLVSKLLLGKLTRENIARLLTYTLQHLNQEFVRIVAMSLKLASYAQPQQPLRNYSDFANIEQLVNLYLNSEGLPQGLYFKLLVGLLSVPNLYHYDAHKLTTLAWQNSNRSRLYSLLAAVLPFHPSEASTFVSRNFTATVLQQLLELLEENKKVGTIVKSPQPQLLLLNSLLGSQSSRNLLLTSRSPIKIVELLQCEKTLLVQYPSQIMKLFISYFQNTCIASECQDEFSEILITLMTSLNSFSSSNQQFFIHHFFFPLINSFQGVTLYFAWTHSAKRIWQPTQVLKASPIRSSSQIIRFEERYYAPIEAIEQSALKQELIVVLQESNQIVYKCSAGKIIDVSTGKQAQYTYSEGSLTIKSAEESSLIIPNEKYAVLEQTSWEQQLLTNATLLNLQNPWVLQQKYRISLLTKDTLAERSYYLPQEIPIAEILKNINIAGFRIHQKDLTSITVKNHLDGSVVEHSKTLKQVLQSQKLPFIRLEIEATQIFQSSTIQSLVDEQPKLGPFVPQETIFRAFEEKKGLEKLIGVLTGCVSNWTNAEQSKIWGQYLKQLESYSCFPVFSSFYVTKQANINLLFDLLFGLPDKQESKKWLQKEKESVKELYAIVKDVFAVQGQQANVVRTYAVKSGFYSTMLNRLHLITKEIKRYRVDEVKEEEEDIVPTLEKKTSEPGDDYKSKLIKKKGVGYGTDSSTNQKWDVTGQEEQRKEQSEQILCLLRILEKYLNNKEFEFPTTMLEETFESSLLPIIENSLRGGSLLQISKYAELIEGELSFIEVLAKSKSLIQTLMPLPKNYEPRQPESLHSLLKTLANTSKIFVSCLTGSASEKVSQEIAKKILSTFQVVDQAVSEYEITHKDQVSIKKILQLPLGKKYPILLKDLRFDYIDMKDTTGKISKHHYSSSYQTGHKSPVEKTVRLAQELADVSHALPIDHTNAIFVRCDRERVDFMQALIMGSNGTPYGHGAYLFDIHFEDNYPNGPPKVNLTTTGSGQIRFNPNLYACGKVCLSLLGTWRGSAMENWDPKVSTLLQVLVSIQSIIMSQDIYFNEPGFEHEQGTLEGEKKNEAYANIVRYGNVKFAMLENIKNPPKGFQTVIRRHFQLKKGQILEQCERWLKLADKRQASYNGLVSDHNYNWCNTFKKSKNQYKTMLEKAVRQLQVQLNKLPQPTLEDTKKEVSPVKKAKKEEKVQPKEEVTEEIDVSYGGARENVEMDINDERVRDRWSRYIGAMGVEAVSKQSKASILLFGMGALGLEIAKNVVLSGCKELALWDDKLTQWDDLSGQFFLGEQDVGYPRLERTIFKLQELNHYVKVSKFEHSPQASLEALASFQVVIATTLSHEQQVKINDYCRLNKIKFISSDTSGPFGQVFNDFGEEFQVLDKNGEETVQVLLEDISIAEKAIVRIAKGFRHPYEDGQTVRIVGVKGMKSTTKEGQSINGSLHKIEVINQFSFYIGSTLEYTPYEGDGTVRNIKTPLKLNFKSLTESVTAQNIDQNLEYYDYSKGAFLRVLHTCFLALSTFKQSQQRIPQSWSKEDSQTFLSQVKKIKSELSDNEISFVKLFSFTCEGNFGAISAFLGGVVAQQAFKAITGKYTPINQYFMVDFSQIVERLPEGEQLMAQFIEQRKPKQVRSDGIRRLIGSNVLQKLENSKVFMVGSGAIGCELLKNFAMIQVGTGGDKGGIIVTDPDHIETSNLNRQFLFRQKHLRKPKSATAAAAVSQMNPRLKGRIKARLQKVCEATKQTFSNSFFQNLTIVTNALDNVQARRYVDSRCVENKVPLLESGTLSSKGHVQVIVPYKTESYGSKQDPNDVNGEVPQCTLKMFPEETLHCVEWARDLFGRDFTLAPKAFAKLLEAGESFKPTQSDLQMLKDCVRMLQSRPNSFQQAIQTATKLFYQLFRNDIMQLLYTYPLDAKTKDGKPFWKLPKRPPTPIEALDAKDLLHATFITSYAVLLCKVHNIPHPNDFRESKRRFEIADRATSFNIVEFTPSDKLAKEMTEEVNNENQKQVDGVATEPAKQELNEVELFFSFNEHLSYLKECGETVTSKAEQFQKDCDQNGHIDLIYSMANLRARNYSLEEMEWIGVKLKAGRITPALSTTTSCIAALQTIELLKYIKGCPVESLRNAFVNLAVPIVQLGEPGEVQKIKVHDKLETNVWERWEVSVGKESPLRELISAVQEKYGIVVKGLDLLEGGQIYSDIVLSLESKKEEKQRVLTKSFMQAVSQFQDSQANNVDLTLLMAVGDQLVQHAPTLRVLLK